VGRSSATTATTTTSTSGSAQSFGVELCVVCGDRASGKSP
jgi:hypothetical protein